MAADPGGARVVGSVVAAAAIEGGLATEVAAHLASAAEAVGRAVGARGFDDATEAAVDVEVVRRGHRVVVRIDDLGLPFAYRDEDDVDGVALADAVAGRWVDEVHHEWRGRAGNRTTLSRHLDPGRDHRAEGPAGVDGPAGAVGHPGDDAEADARGIPSPAAPAHTARLAGPDDAEAICRLTWRTYGPTYQHDEYYQPGRLAHLLADGTQVSFLTVLDTGEVVGHSAVVLEGPGAVVVEGGRAMVDPRYRGHHLMAATHELRDRWFAEHGVLALTGAAVTAHTRSQRDGPVLSMMLGFLPPVHFAGIDGTDTALREAVVGGIFPMAELPPQGVLVPRRDADALDDLYAVSGLPRDVTRANGSGPDRATSALDLRVVADLGHAVVRVATVGEDLADALGRRLEAVARSGIDVTYIDLALDDPAVSWAADVAADAGCVFAGLRPLERQGVDEVRYQHLGATRVDRDAIHLRHPQARALLDYVLSQRQEAR
ncbi:MAG: hypothetical protein MUF83_14425 [Acidimicrobiales bacterium]|nr:hypothetical protein [Acidimicrobiales bacterium]